MSKIVSNLKSFSGGLLALTVSLIVLMWVLNYAGSKGWGPLSTVANWTQAHITPAPGVTVVTPPNQVQPNSYHGF
jgi:hypothetical protein